MIQCVCKESLVRDCRVASFKLRVMRVNLQLHNKTPSFDSLRLQGITGKGMYGGLIQIKGDAK